MLKRICLNDFRSFGVSSGKIDMAPLQVVFQGIVNCLSKSGASYWKTRCSLYGAILYFMQIGKQQSSVVDEGMWLCSLRVE